MKKHILNKNIQLLATILLVFLLLPSCGTKEKKKSTGGGTSEYSLTASISVNATLQNKNQFDTAQKTGLFNKPKDVVKITILASWGKGKNKYSIDPVDCEKDNISDSWQCNLTDLPVDTDITFSLSALNIADKEIYNYKEVVNIPDNTPIIIKVTLVETCSGSKVPVSIVPELISYGYSSPPIMGVPLTLNVSIEDYDSDFVSIEYNSDFGGTFDPATENLELLNNSATTSTIYTPAILPSDYSDIISIALNDDPGCLQSYKTDIDILVVSNVGDVSYGDPPVNFPPSITGISSNVDVNLVTLTAHVDDENPSILSYVWKIDNVQVGTTKSIILNSLPLGTQINLTVSDEHDESENYSLFWG